MYRFHCMPLVTFSIQKPKSDALIDAEKNLAS